MSWGIVLCPFKRHGRTNLCAAIQRDNFCVSMTSFVSLYSQSWRWEQQFTDRWVMYFARCLLETACGGHQVEYCLEQCVWCVFANCVHFACSLVFFFLHPLFFFFHPLFFFLTPLVFFTSLLFQFPYSSPTLDSRLTKASSKNTAKMLCAGRCCIWHQRFALVSCEEKNFLKKEKKKKEKRKVIFRQIKMWKCSARIAVVHGSLHGTRVCTGELSKPKQKVKRKKGKTMGLER